MRAPAIITIPAADGYLLAAELFAPRAPNGSTVVINGAMGVARRFYHAFAQHLAAHGFQVVCYDYRGIGGSAPSRLRGFSASITDWGSKDFAGVLDWIACELRPQRLLVVGHSVGGQIIGMAPQAQRVDRVLLVAAQSGYWKHWPGVKRAAMWLVWHALIPVLTPVAGKMPMKVFGQGEDLPAGVALQWAHWGRLPGYLFDACSGIDTTAYRNLRMPICAYGFDDDPYAPPPAVEALLEQYPGARIVRRQFGTASGKDPAIGHFGFFKTAGVALWDEAAAWLSAETAQAA